MYVSYLQLDKDSSMYQGPVPRHAGLGGQNFPAPAPPQYPDFGYHHHHHHPPPLGLGLDPPQQTGPGGWSPVYPPPPAAASRDDWSAHHYAVPPPPAPPGGPPPLGFAPDFGTAGPALLGAAGPQSPGSPPRRNPYDWIRRSTAPPANPNGKTRTKDKYRVVYTDHQRLELEKEFHYSRYITIRRKAELAAALSLSERQVKIWFQNRRAKERKINKKKQQQQQQQQQQPAPSTTTPTPPGGGGGAGGGAGAGALHRSGGVAMVTSSSGLASPSSLPLNIKEEY